MSVVNQFVIDICISTVLYNLCKLQACLNNTRHEPLIFAIKRFLSLLPAIQVCTPADCQVHRATNYSR